MPEPAFWMPNQRGLQFDFEKPEEYPYNIGEIAASLAKQCRYNGNTKGFYSVAEHCVLLFDYAAEKWDSEISDNFHQWLRTVLLHDAAEAFTGDLVRHIKLMISKENAIIELEHRIEAAISKHFDLSTDPEVLAQIKQWDHRILVDERAQCFPGHYRACDWNLSGPALEVELEKWEWLDAEQEFMKRYAEVAV